jgi:hypothetical protein
VIARDKTTYRYTLGEEVAVSNSGSVYNRRRGRVVGVGMFGSTDYVRVEVGGAALPFFGFELVPARWLEGGKRG